MGGEDGSSPISFSATTTCAELETGKSSASPCTMARMMTFSDIGRFSTTGLIISPFPMETRSGFHERTSLRARDADSSGRGAS